MRSSAVRMLLYVTVFFIAYQYRYRLINAVLGIQPIRRTVVSSAMGIPFVRRFFLLSAFR